jgi:hypothetical protein
MSLSFSICSLCIFSFDISGAFFFILKGRKEEEADVEMKEKATERDERCIQLECRVNC